MPWPVAEAGPANPFCSIWARAIDGCEATPPSIIAMRVPPGARPAAPVASRATAGLKRSACGFEKMVIVGVERWRGAAQRFERLARVHLRGDGEGDEAQAKAGFDLVGDDAEAGAVGGGEAGRVGLDRDEAVAADDVAVAVARKLGLVGVGEQRQAQLAQVEQRFGACRRPTRRAWSTRSNAPATS